MYYFKKKNYLNDLEVANQARGNLDITHEDITSAKQNRI